MKKSWLLVILLTGISASVYATRLSSVLYTPSIQNSILNVTASNNSIANLSMEVVRRFVDNINTVREEEAEAQNPPPNTYPTSFLTNPDANTNQFDVYSASFRLAALIATSILIFLYLLKTLSKNNSKPTKSDYSIN